GWCGGFSVLPESAEAIRSKLGVEHSVLDVFVPQVVLDGTSILAVVGELEAGRMPQRVRMDRHAQLGRVASASEQLTERSGGHRRATLGDKDVGAVWIFT